MLRIIVITIQFIRIRHTMKWFVICLMFVACALATSAVLPVTTLVRTPEDDKATIESIRINGNFAYRTMEGKAYKTITPLLGHVVAPGPLIPFNLFYVEA